MTDIFLGEPPADIKTWIIEHQGPAEHAETIVSYNDGSISSFNILNSIECTYDSIGNPAPTTQIPNLANIVKIDFGTDLTSIGAYSLVGLNNMISAIIPNSITDIGEQALSYNYALQTVILGNGITAIADSTFSTCSSLTGIIIPNSVVRIDSYAFESCKKMINITLPNSITAIGEDCFYNCTSLTSVTIIDNGGNSANVKQMLINAGVDPNVTWNT